MKGLYRRISIFIFVIIVISVGFSVYTNFIVDYSLEGLETALHFTNKVAGDTDLNTSRVYQTILRDLVIQEVAEEDLDVQKVIALEHAERSLEETEERGGFGRSQFYLKQFKKAKTPERNTLLRQVDHLYRILAGYYQSFLGFIRFLHQKIFRRFPERQESFEYSSFLLLNQAEEKEKNKDYGGAAELYRRYLDIYSDRPDRGFVSISLANVLIKQRKIKEAKEILRQIQMAFAGLEEAEIASVVMRRIDVMQQVDKDIGELLRMIPQYYGMKEEKILKLRLALSYIKSYRFSSAREILSDLSHSEDEEIRQKARFYLGWVYKLDAQYDQGAAVFLELLEDPNLDKDLGLGLQAQLADIYYRTNQLGKAVSYYQGLSQEARKRGVSGAKIQDTWIDLAELEQASIYYFDLDNEVEARKHLENLEENPAFENIQKEIEASSVGGDVREKIFEALKNKKIDVAFSMFQKVLRNHPNDPLSHGGLATIYVLMTDIQRANYYAKRAYELGADEYTTSIYAYTEWLVGNREGAKKLYEEAIRSNPQYFPARFNLAYLLIRMGDYEEAADTLAEAERDFPSLSSGMLAKVRNNIGCALWFMGQIQGAQDQFRAALELNPDFDVAKVNYERTRMNENPEPEDLRESMWDRETAT
ncbi:MAG: tetratricopeptide repeat protein [Candidatus Omnitrophica bacterium]|nr:tetratricopeptide repeat protein [Candidatus Omnitrophota bacterium]